MGKRKKKAREKLSAGKRKNEGRESSTAPALPSFLPFFFFSFFFFFFRVRAFSIQRGRDYQGTRNRLYLKENINPLPKIDIPVEATDFRGINATL